MTTETVEKTGPAYRVRRNTEGLTEKQVQVRDLLNQTGPKLTQNEIAERMGVNKQRISEWKKMLEDRGLLTAPKPVEPLSRAEWDATRKALLGAAKSAGSGTSPGRAAARALDKIRDGLLPKGVSW